MTYSCHEQLLSFQWKFRVQCLRHASRVMFRLQRAPWSVRLSSALFPFGYLRVLHARSTASTRVDDTNQHPKTRTEGTSNPLRGCRQHLSTLLVLPSVAAAHGCISDY